MRVAHEILDACDRPRMVYQTLQDFRAEHQRTKFKIQDGDDSSKIVTLGEEWLDWPQRRQFKGVIFDPSGRDRPGYLNLWKGFSVNPAPGRWDLFRRHMKTILCGGCEESYSYLFSWLAHMYQHPEDPPGTAIVLRSEKKGTGKSFFADYIREPFGHHAMMVNNPEHVWGRFGGHLEDKVCLTLEEGFFTGKRSHEGSLKALITERTLAIEPKGMPAKNVPNFLHLIIISNEDWVVPASCDERRFLVLEVDPSHAQDTAYFRAMARQMDNGGLAAMLYDLRRHKYDRDTLRTPPRTEALAQQKIKSLPPCLRWLYQSLLDGELLGSPWPQERAEVAKGDLTASLEDHCKTTSTRSRRGYEIELGKALMNVFDANTYRPATGRGLGDNRPRVVCLPGLATAREMFAEKVLGQSYAWPSPGPVAVPAPGSGPRIVRPALRSAS